MIYAGFETMEASKEDSVAPRMTVLQRVEIKGNEKNGWEYAN